MTKVTIKDVATAAGVSVATVSYVLNETPGKNISDATRRRVLQSVQDLGYIPNSAAKRLKSSRSKCIAIRLATTLSIPRYYLALQGFRALLSEADDRNIRIIEYEAPDADLSEYLTTDFHSSSALSSQLSAKLLEIYRSALASSSPSTGIIDTFENAHSLLAPQLYLHHVLHPENETVAWYDRSLSYTFPYYEAGYEAARSLIETIDGSQTVRKLVFQPTLIPIEAGQFELLS